MNSKVWIVTTILLLALFGMGAYQGGGIGTYAIAMNGTSKIVIMDTTTGEWRTIDVMIRRPIPRLYTKEMPDDFDERE